MTLDHNCTKEHEIDVMAAHVEQIRTAIIGTPAEPGIAESIRVLRSRSDDTQAAVDKIEADFYGNGKPGIREEVRQLMARRVVLDRILWLALGTMTTTLGMILIDRIGG